MGRFMIPVRRFLGLKEGSAIVENGPMVALTAVVRVTAASLLGTSLRGIYHQIAAAI